MLQPIIDLLYRNPRSVYKEYKRYGGYLAYRNMLNERDQMAKAAFKLPPSPSYKDGLSIYFLTGKNYLFQTLFCIRSLIAVSPERFNFILVDDGSFTRQLISQIQDLLPDAPIITADIINANLERRLPAKDHPNLIYRRSVYPHIKKLTDIHTLSDGWKLVLDSDMLFWRNPVEIISWLQNPDRPIYMQDCMESYGYSQTIMEKLCGRKIPSLLNVGVIGLKSESVDWKNIDNWIKELEEGEGTSYYLEQAITAMLVATAPGIVLNSEQYRVNPTKLANTDDILHHYVDLSKKIYFDKAWRKVV